MPHPLLIFSQSDYLIQVIDTNSHSQWQTVQIQISCQLIWIYTVCKGRVWPGSAGPGLSSVFSQVCSVVTGEFFCFSGFTRFKLQPTIVWPVSRWRRRSSAPGNSQTGSVTAWQSSGKSTSIQGFCLSNHYPSMGTTNWWYFSFDTPLNFGFCLSCKIPYSTQLPHIPL